MRVGNLCPTGLMEAKSLDLTYGRLILPSPQQSYLAHGMWSFEEPLATSALSSLCWELVSHAPLQLDKLCWSDITICFGHAHEQAHASGSSGSMAAVSREFPQMLLALSVVGGSAKSWPEVSDHLQMPLTASVVASGNHWLPANATGGVSGKGQDGEQQPPAGTVNSVGGSFS